jgi:hypothetical protein
VLVALAVAVGLGLPGCGGSDDDSKDKAKNVFQVDEDFARYSVDEVSDRFKRLTGVQLARQSGGSKTLKILSSRRGAPPTRPALATEASSSP